VSCAAAQSSPAETTEIELPSEIADNELQVGLDLNGT